MPGGDATKCAINALPARPDTFPAPCALSINTLKSLNMVLDLGNGEVSVGKAASLAKNGGRTLQIPKGEVP
jgi:hypothetical protein